MKQQSFWNKRIPTFLALLLVVIGIGITAYITGTSTVFKSGASTSEAPKNIRITNINDTFFTITYTTDTATLGSVSFGKDTSLGTVLLDDRDQITNTPHPYTIHSLTVKNLLANTQYYFSITSGNTTYMNNTIPYVTTTGQTLSGSSPLQQVLSGTVTLPADNNGSGSLVYLQIPNGQIISTMTDLQGNYHISLANIRTPDLLHFASVANTDTIGLIFTDGTAISHVATTLKNFPMPSIVLSQDYDFTTSSSPTGVPIANVPDSFPLFSTLPNIQNPAGSQLFDSATPSATIIPTLTVTPTQGAVTTPTVQTSPTKATALSPTITPTVGATATPAPTIGATATPMPTSFIPTPTKASLPSTGNDSIFTIGIASIIMTIVGIGIFFLTKIA